MHKRLFFKFFFSMFVRGNNPHVLPVNCCYRDLCWVKEQQLMVNIKK